MCVGGCGVPAPSWWLIDEDSRKGAESSGPYRGVPSLGSAASVSLGTVSRPGKALGSRPDQ